MATRPPERIETESIVLRRHEVADATGLAAAVSETLDDLRMWMPWANEESATVESQHARLVRVLPYWEADSEYTYVVVAPGVDTIAGCVGLHRRIGPGAIEIGYWIAKQFQGRGWATHAARALTDAALALDDIERVEIHCDRANVRSRAIPPRLGYRLDRIEPDAVTAPGEVGESMIWVLERA